MSPYLSNGSEMPHRQNLVESTVQVLVSRLDSGRWTGFLPGERALCEELQVSRPTLRKALEVLEREGRVEVAQGCRRRITGGQAGGKPSARKNIIGILSPLPLKSLSPFTLFCIDEVRSALAKSGYQLEFHNFCASNKPARALERLVHSSPCALWILLLAAPPVQKWFSAQKVPCIVAGSCAPEESLPSVDIDYYAACRHAAGVFRRKGHDRLALVIPSGGLIGDLDSEAGFCAGLKNGHSPVVLRHDGTRESIILQVERCLRLPEPPTGFLVARSAHAVTVLMLLVRRGYKLPTQAAIISRDDDTFLNFVTPNIARYNSDPAKFSRQLMRIILQMVHSGAPPKRPVKLMPRFHPGETV